MSEDTVSDSYTAWDNNNYPWPPPEGWYQATGGLWWPEEYGPGPAPAELTQSDPGGPAVDTPPMRPQPVAGTFSPPVADMPTTVDLPPGTPAVVPPASVSEPVPSAPAPAAFGQSTTGATAPGAAASSLGPAPGYAASGPSTTSSSTKGGSGKILALLLGLLVVVMVAAGAAFFLLGNAEDDDVGTTTSTTLNTATTLPPSTAPVTAAPAGPGSLNDPWAINDPIGIFYDDLANDGEQARWTVQVTAGAIDGTELVLAASEQNRPPAGGQIYVLVPIRLTYKSGPAPVQVANLEFKALGPSARVLTESGDSCGIIPNDLDDQTELFPGGTIEGNLCWATPASDLGGLKLIVEVRSAEGAVYIDING